MLQQLDVLIRDTLVAEIPTLTVAQVVFQPPDDDLRLAMGNAGQPIVDVFLAELRENRGLRSNARVPVVEDGFVYTEPSPERVDCHYLISVWSPAARAAGVPVEPEVTVEHPLLYQIGSALFRRAPLNPSRAYPPLSPRLATWPAQFQEHDLPTQVLPPDGYPRVGDLWHTMGTRSRWRPTVHLVVTLPIVRVREMAGALVTTLRTDHRIRNVATSAEVIVQIGGSVVNGLAVPPALVAGAWVRLEEMTGATVGLVRTNAAGRFTFSWISEGFYRLRVTADGLPVLPPRDIRVPSETGEYDFRF